MNTAEQSVAVELMRHSNWPKQPGDALVLADGVYDSRHTYQAADACGTRLLTPLKGKSKKPQQLKEMGPARREAVRAWEAYPAWCRYVLRDRIGIEQDFAALCASSQGLCGLPPFIRRLDRVRRWVGAKLIWHNAAICVAAAHTKQVAA